MALSLLEKINSSADLKNLSRKDLPVLADEIRKVIVEVVSKTGGHLASSLGSVELAIAIHYVFDTPNDKLIWDVGHQAYAHKLLTGRRDQFHSLRQHKGISGFTLSHKHCSTLLWICSKLLVALTALYSCLITPYI